jgi:sialate O-acetylesterase
MYYTLALALLISLPAEAAEDSPALMAEPGLPFKNHAVLQQLIPLPVWGTTLPGATVTVSFDGQTHSTLADKTGAWRVVLEPLAAVKLTSVNDTPTEKTMTITTSKDGQTATRTITGIVIGEIWLCAGQSNMAGSLKSIIEKTKGSDGQSIMVRGKVKESRLDYYPADTITSAQYPGLRQLDFPDAEWTACSPDTAWRFKKVCFFFGRRIQEDILIPVGIINTSVGGSKIESWLNQPSSETGKHYESMVAPLEGFGIRGMLWYQGESNADDKRGYQPKLESLILGWRKAWNQAGSKESMGPRSDFSAYFVQLPGISVSPTNSPAMGDGRAEIRQACVETLKLPHTGMAIALDLGDEREHPPNKLDTGLRLARLALHHDYGKTDLVPSGPLYKSHRIEGRTIRVAFDYAENGLMVAEKDKINFPEEQAGAQPGWISIQDKDGRWYWADAQIDGSELIVSSREVNNPIAVRYAYTNRPIGPLLYSKDGLPVSPFTTCGYDPSITEGQ